MVLSREEIKSIIDAIKNPEHKLIISLAYGAGLRISEVVSLKVKDVNLGKLTIHLKNANGKKTELPFFRKKSKTYSKV
ncbi:MAG: tyrosine-type recombinase/integrase [Minisyncoccia bacterium]